MTGFLEAKAERFAVPATRFALARVVNVPAGAPYSGFETEALLVLSLWLGTLPHMLTRADAF